MSRYCLLAIVGPLLFLTALGAGEGEKKKPEDGKDKDKDKKVEKILPPPPKLFLVAVELKDGSTFQAEWLGPPMLAFTTADLGALQFKREAVRFIDLEGPTNRVATQDLEMFYGTLDSVEFNLKLTATEETLTVPRDRVKRLVFPDRPRVYGIP